MSMLTNPRIPHLDLARERRRAERWKLAALTLLIVLALTLAALAGIVRALLEVGV